MKSVERLPGCQIWPEDVYPSVWRTDASGELAVTTLSGSGVPRRKLSGPRDHVGRHLVTFEDGSVIVQQQGWNPLLRRPPANATIHLDPPEGLSGSATYRTDRLGRVVQVQVDQLHLVDRPAGSLTKRRHLRHGREQRRWGQGYDGGHLVGTQFFGAGERLNLAPMPRRMNRAVAGYKNWRSLESTWEKHLRRGGTVEVMIEISYAGETEIPKTILVRYKLDGVAQTPVPFKKFYTRRPSTAPLLSGKPRTPSSGRRKGRTR
ncbi:DNA/RNA non-specific endonuclease [Kineococcus indalonis]|uniref:DNA/RNA non-specific endonuclease n=1 Tax=Kineococcus indalonis TaxID=2696566 RepID=UPI0038994303